MTQGAGLWINKIEKWPKFFDLRRNNQIVFQDGYKCLYEHQERTFP